MENNNKNTEDPKPDLKHDTMEFSAATDGDDILDTDLEIEEDEITAEELEIIDNNENDELAEGLNSVELDREADDELYFEETGEEDDDEEDEAEEKETRR